MVFKCNKLRFNSSYCIVILINLLFGIRMILNLYCMSLIFSLVFKASIAEKYCIIDKKLKKSKVFKIYD